MRVYCFLNDRTSQSASAEFTLTMKDTCVDATLTYPGRPIDEQVIPYLEKIIDVSANVQVASVDYSGCGAVKTTIVVPNSASVGDNDYIDAPSTITLPAGGVADYANSIAIPV